MIVVCGGARFLGWFGALPIQEYLDDRYIGKTAAHEA
jgi:hypothetical protein